MTPDVTNEDSRPLHARVHDLWNRTAEWWDKKVGAEGNDFHRLLIAPASERLLTLTPGEVVLDVACGNGQFARRMAELGARVLAFDFSEKFIERARARTAHVPHGGRVEYRVLDATDREALLALGPRRFDAAVCTMALMDMADYVPLMAALREIIKPGGRFVFSMMHPCFNSTGTRMVIEEAYAGTELRPVFSIRVTEYLRPSVKSGVGIVGQPVQHIYFHRPLSALLQPCFDAGFVLDGMEEPSYQDTAAPRAVFSWRNFTEIPAALVARLRLPG